MLTCWSSCSWGRGSGWVFSVLVLEGVGGGTSNGLGFLECNTIKYALEGICLRDRLTSCLELNLTLHMASLGGGWLMGINYSCGG